MNRSKLIFLGVIACILLGLYVYATTIAVLTAQCKGTSGCTSYTGMTEGLLTVLNLVGGLVSALVVVELAVTPVGQAPAARLVGGKASTALTTVKIVALIYILVWLLCGLASLIFGYLQYPDQVPELTASGKSWLGTAVASSYSYLGVKPGGSGN
jgi:hypothetical protein